MPWSFLLAVLATAAPAGWVAVPPVESFAPSALFNHIDGGAELFLEFGFADLTVQRYRRQGSEDEISLEVYRMRDPAAALGVYLAKCGREQREPSFAPRHTIGSYQLQFQQERYFVLVTSSAGRDEDRAALLALGRAVVAGLPADRDVPELTLLPRKDQRPGSLRLVRGPFALQPILTLGPGDPLGLGGTITAVTADYAPPGAAPFSLLVAEYPSPAGADATLARVRAGLDPDLRVTSSGPGKLVLAGADGRTITLAGTGRRLTITF